MRIDPKPLSAYPWYLRPMFWRQRRKYGHVLNPVLLWARMPRLFLAAALVFRILDRRGSPVDPALRALVSLRVSQLNGCGFCIDMNGAMLAERGVPVAKAKAVESWRSGGPFDERERAALAYAEAMTRSDLRVDDALMDGIRRHWSADAVIELTALIAFQNLSSKFNSALDVPPQGLCRVPIRDSQGPAA